MIETYLLIQNAMRFLLFNTIVGYLVMDQADFISILFILLLTFILVIILLIKQLRMKYK